MFRVSPGAATIVLAACCVSACQSPTSTSAPDFIVATTTPDPAQASGPGTGKFYKILGDATHPDQILEYDWLTHQCPEPSEFEDAVQAHPSRGTA